MWQKIKISSAILHKTIVSHGSKVLFEKWSFSRTWSWWFTYVWRAGALRIKYQFIWQKPTKNFLCVPICYKFPLLFYVVPLLFDRLLVFGIYSEQCGQVIYHSQNTCARNISNSPKTVSVLRSHWHTGYYRLNDISASRRQTIRLRSKYVLTRNKTWGERCHVGLTATK